jgi:hypothetical protein
MSNTDITYLKEVLRILDPYASIWCYWTKTEACFLTKEEVKVIESYVYFRSYDPISEELNITILHSAIILREAMFKLQFNLRKFEHWQENCVRDSLLENFISLN